MNVLAARCSWDKWIKWNNIYRNGESCLNERESASDFAVGKPSDTKTIKCIVRAAHAHARVCITVYRSIAFGFSSAYCLGLARGHQNCNNTVFEDSVASFRVAIRRALDRTPQNSVHRFWIFGSLTSAPELRAGQHMFTHQWNNINSISFGRVSRWIRESVQTVGGSEIDILVASGQTTTHPLLNTTDPSK